MPDAAVEIVPLTLASYDVVDADIHRYWVGGRVPVMHRLFVHEFGDLSIVAMTGSVVAGFLFGLRSTTEPAGYVHLIGVREDRRRRGIAQQLYAAFAERVGSTGAEHLKAIVRPDNQPSIDFHASLGMTAELVDDYAAPGQPRLVFRGPIASFTARTRSATEREPSATGNTTMGDGRPILVDDQADSADPSLPAFLAPPDDAPAYHGFTVRSDLVVDGFTLGLITPLSSAPNGSGDAFLIAPDGARCGVVWEISASPYVDAISEPSPERFGVFAVGFASPLVDDDAVRAAIRSILPTVRHHWDEWRNSSAG